MSVGRILGLLAQIVLALCGCFALLTGLTVTTESASHQIYQANLVGGGLLLFAVVGLWAAVDGLAGRIAAAVVARQEQPAGPAGKEKAASASSNSDDLPSVF